MFFLLKVFSFVKQKHQTVFEINQGESTEQPWIETLIDSLPTAFDFEAIETDGKLDFSFAKGTYTYNGTNKTWSKVSNNANTMTFIFPSSSAIAPVVNIITPLDLSASPPFKTVSNSVQDTV